MSRIGIWLWLGILVAGCGSAPVTDGEIQPGEHHRRGLALYASGDREAAVEELKKGLELDPTQLRLRFDKARIQMEIGMIKDLQAMRLENEAREARRNREFTRAVEKERKAIALRNQAIPYLEEARDDFLRIWAADDSDPNTAFFLGRIYASLEDYENARKFFELAYETGRPTGLLRRKLDLAIEQTEEAIYRREKEEE